jgi:hypothetical protein
MIQVMSVLVWCMRIPTYLFMQRGFEMRQLVAQRHYNDAVACTHSIGWFIFTPVRLQ